MNILVTMPADETRDTFITEEISKIIQSMGKSVWNESAQQFSADELGEKIKEADVCICGWSCPRFDRSVLEGAERLKIIAYTGGSVAPIVSDYLYEKGIKVISGNQLFAESVAEGVIAYMLCSLREIPFWTNTVQSGKWSADISYNEGLLEQRIGLVGFGMVSKHLVNMLKPFRVSIKVYDPFASSETLSQYGVEGASLEEIFSTSKIISLHAPKTPDTYHMIGRELLQTVPDGALLVNTARGSIIDEEALADELMKKRFKAVLDVFETEPLPADSKLRGLQNVILIPHMAGPTVDRRKYITTALLDDIRGFFEGKHLKYEISREYAMMMTR